MKVWLQTAVQRQPRPTNQLLLVVTVRWWRHHTARPNVRKDLQPPKSLKLQRWTILRHLLQEGLTAHLGRGKGRGRKRRRRRRRRKQWQSDEKFKRKDELTEENCRVCSLFLIETCWECHRELNIIFYCITSSCLIISSCSAKLGMYFLTRSGSDVVTHFVHWGGPAGNQQLHLLKTLTSGETVSYWLKRMRLL